MYLGTKEKDSVSDMSVGRSGGRLVGSAQVSMWLKSDQTVLDGIVCVCKQDKTRQDKTRQDTTRQNKTRKTRIKL